MCMYVCVCGGGGVLTGPCPKSWSFKKHDCLSIPNTLLKHVSMDSVSHPSPSSSSPIHHEEERSDFNVVGLGLGFWYNRG